MRSAAVQDDLGLGHGVEHLRDDRVGGDVVGERLIRQHDAVPHHVEGKLADVVRQHVVTAVQERERPGAGDEGDRGARAGPLADVPLQVAEPGTERPPGCGYQAHGVVDDGGIDVDLPHALLHGDQVRRAEHRADRFGVA